MRVGCTAIKMDMRMPGKGMNINEGKSQEKSKLASVLDYFSADFLAE